MVSTRRRTLLLALGLLLAAGLLALAVGRHPTNAAPNTTFEPIGRLDLAASRIIDDLRLAPLTWLALVLHWLGRGVVLTPLRALVAAWLLRRRRLRDLAAWVAAWAAVEVLVSAGKVLFHRGRPPEPLVGVDGFAFPSGHAANAAATALLLALLLTRRGRDRAAWALGAAAYAVVMAASRVYLEVHWASDVAVGVLLGWGVAAASAPLAARNRG